jgi:hypothetical protein
MIYVLDLQKVVAGIASGKTPVYIAGSSWLWQDQNDRILSISFDNPCARFLLCTTYQPSFLPGREVVPFPGLAPKTADQVFLRWDTAEPY